MTPELILGVEGVAKLSTMLVAADAHALYRGLVLTDSALPIIDYIKSQTIDTVYLASIRHFRFRKGGALWVCPLPRDQVSLFRYAGMRFHDMLIQGNLGPDYIEYLMTRIGGQREHNISLSLTINGKTEYQKEANDAQVNQA